MNIGLDIMGGDFAPEQAILGVQMYLQQKQDTSVHLILIGDPEKAAPYISVIEQFKGKWTLVPSTQEIEMEEHPTRALKEKPESSIAIGFGMLMHKKIDAFIKLKTIPGRHLHFRCIETGFLSCSSSCLLFFQR